MDTLSNMLVLLFGEIYQFDVHSTFVITLNLFMQTHATKHMYINIVDNFSLPTEEKKAARIWLNAQ